MRAKAVATLAAIMTAAASSAAHAQDYPSKPVTMVMPYAAGGPGDVITRILAQGMGTVFNQTIMVENIPGAGGTIGSAKVSNAPPEGYTLLVMHIGAATNPALYPNIKYDAMTDFEPIGLITEGPSVFVARKDFPVATFGELVAYVKANNTKVNYAHAGIGSASHLCGLLFASALDTTFTTVPYRGAGPALNDLIGGQVDFMCDQTINVIANANAGAIKAYAVTSKAREPTLPHLPTAAEAGMPGFNLTIWFALWASKGTPKPIIDKLVGALGVALASQPVKDKLAALGAPAVGPERANPAALEVHLKAEIARWGPIIRRAGVVGAQ